MCKELTVYQDCIWYISCECMYVRMPRAMYASGWSRQASQINLFGVRYRVICCVLGTKLTEKKGTSLCTDLSFCAS